MLYSVLPRTPTGDADFEAFREACHPDRVDDGIEFRVIHARNLANPGEITSIGFVDIEPSEVGKFAERSERQNVDRHERIQPFLDGERVFLGLYEELSNDEIAL